MLNTKITKSFIIASAAALVVFTGCNSGAGIGNPDLESRTDSVSYSLGYQNGSFLQQQGMSDIDPGVMMAGMRDALQEEDARLTDAEMRTVVQMFQMEVQQKQQAQMQEEAEENRKKGEEFLAENRNAQGVRTTESGLQYKVLEEGTGKSPNEEDTVSVHYEGTLLDGTVFDSSYERDEPATFPLNRVIKGWTEGVQLMKEGATYRFYIPAELGYGTNTPPGGSIGPNETLIFKVELLEVK